MIQCRDKLEQTENNVFKNIEVRYVFNCHIKISLQSLQIKVTDNCFKFIEVQIFKKPGS